MNTIDVKTNIEMAIPAYVPGLCKKKEGRGENSRGDASRKHHFDYESVEILILPFLGHFEVEGRVGRRICVNDVLATIRTQLCR